MSEDYGAGADINIKEVGGETQTANDSAEDMNTIVTNLASIGGKITKVDTDAVVIATNQIVRASSLTSTAVTVGTSTAEILAFNANRVGFGVYNNTEGAELYLFGTTTADAFPILWKGSYADSGQGVYRGSVVAASSTADTDVRVIEQY